VPRVAVGVHVCNGRLVAGEQLGLDVALHDVVVGVVVRRKRRVGNKSRVCRADAHVVIARRKLLTEQADGGGGRLGGQPLVQRVVGGTGRRPPCRATQDGSRKSQQSSLVEYSHCVGSVLQRLMPRRLQQWDLSKLLRWQLFGELRSDLVWRLLHLYSLERLPMYFISEPTHSSQGLAS
jgi:hypothetical protein